MHSTHVLLGSVCFFALVFSVANRLSYRHVKVYRDFSIPEQGDWCSRYGAEFQRTEFALTVVCPILSSVNSSIHAVVIVAGMAYTFAHQKWDDDLRPLNDTQFTSTLFSFSCGYFLFDLVVLVLWQVPLWRVFVVHHIVAVVPYLIYTMHSGCGMDLYLLQLFLLVEFAVIPLNIATFLEQLGYGKSKLHAFFFYLTYACWFVARVLLPLYNVYVLWTRVIPDAGAAPFCTVPAAFCGHIIAAFCVGVFIFVWTPDVLAKWRVPVLQMEEYPDYKLTMRQSMTPRSNPITTPSSDKWGASYGSVSGSTTREPQWTSKSVV